MCPAKNERNHCSAAVSHPYPCLGTHAPLTTSSSLVTGSAMTPQQPRLCSWPPFASGIQVGHEGSFNFPNSASKPHEAWDVCPVRPQGNCIITLQASRDHDDHGQYYRSFQGQLCREGHRPREMDMGGMGGGRTSHGKWLFTSCEEPLL